MVISTSGVNSPELFTGGSGGWVLGGNKWLVYNASMVFNHHHHLTKMLSFKYR